MRFGDGALGIVRQLGGDFQAHKACFTARAVVFGAAHVASGLHVGDGEGFVDFFGGFVLLFQGFNFGNIERVAGKGFLEDGGVGGYAAYAVGKKPGEFAALHQAAREVIQPDLLPELFDLFDGGHAVFLCDGVIKGAIVKVFLQFG